MLVATMFGTNGTGVCTAAPPDSVGFRASVTGESMRTPVALSPVALPPRHARRPPSAAWRLSLLFVCTPAPSSLPRSLSELINADGKQWVVERKIHFHGGLFFVASPHTTSKTSQDLCASARTLSVCQPIGQSVCGLGQHHADVFWACRARDVAGTTSL